MTVDPKHLKKTKDFAAKEIAFGMARVPKSGRLFYGSSDFHVYVVDAAAEKPESKPLEGEGHTSYATSVALAGDNLVSGSYDGRLIWWDADEGEQVAAVDAHEKWIRNLAVSPDGKTIASVADDMQCHLWDVESRKKIRSVSDHQAKTPHHYPSMLYAVAFSPDGKLLATADKVGHIAVWDTANGKKLQTLEAPVMYTWDPRQRRHSIGGIRSLAFSHDSKQLAAGGIGKIGNIDHLGGPSRVEVFDWKSGKRLHELEDNKLKGLVEQIRFHPSGEWFLAAGGDHGGFVTFYDAKTGKVIKQEKAPMHVHDVDFSKDYSTLYAVGHGKIALWSLNEAK